MKEWTIDTWVFYRADEGDIDAAELLLSVARNHKIVLDYEGAIESEYSRFFKSAKSRFIAECYKLLANRGAKVFYSGKLPQRHERALLRLKFDRSDLPFVAVASKSKDKLLVSEDSDYTPIICDYLSRQLQVQVLKVAQAVNLAIHDP